MDNKKLKSENTKLVMLNSPSNPTGSVYSKDELKKLAEILLKHPNVFIGTDDIYEKINLMMTLFIISLWLNQDLRIG